MSSDHSISAAQGISPQTPSCCSRLKEWALKNPAKAAAIIAVVTFILLALATTISVLKTGGLDHLTKWVNQILATPISLKNALLAFGLPIPLAVILYKIITSRPVHLLYLKCCNQIKPVILEENVTSTGIESQSVTISGSSKWDELIRNNDEWVDAKSDAE